MLCDWKPRSILEGEGGVVLQGEVSAVIRRRRRDVGQINTADVHSQSLDSKRIGTQGNGAAEKEEKDRTTSVG